MKKIIGIDVKSLNGKKRVELVQDVVEIVVIVKIMHYILWFG
jgi:hypothetical protein